MFDCQELSSPSLALPFALHLSKLIRKCNFSFFGTSNKSGPCKSWSASKDCSLQPHCLITIKAKPVSFPCNFWIHFQTCVGACTAFPESLVMSAINLFIPSYVCVCSDATPPHLNHILRSSHPAFNWLQHRFSRVYSAVKIRGPERILIPLSWNKHLSIQNSQLYLWFFLFQSVYVSLFFHHLG